jgi:prophage antirepressor-like protein
MTEIAIPVQIFDWDGYIIRTFDLEDQRVAVASDLCKALDIKNIRQNVAKLDRSDYVTISRSDAIDSTYGIWQQMNPRVQQITLITEDGAADLVLMSRKPDAQAFRRFLTHTVWRSIRETGSYSVAHEIPQTYAQALRVAADQAERAEFAEAKVIELEPKAVVYDDLMSSEGTYSFQVAGDMVGWGRTTMLAELRRQDILQTDSPSHNVPYRRWMHHFKVIPRTRDGKNGELIPYYVTEIRASSIPWLRARLADVVLAIDNRD